MNDIIKRRRANLVRLIDTRYAGSQTNFSNATGIKLSQIGQWLDVSGENARNMSERSARKIEVKSGLPENWMDSQSDDASVPSDTAKPMPVIIRQYEDGGSMGNGLELRDQPGLIRQWQVSHEWLSKNVRSYSATKNLCIVTGFGDSMEPMFNPGDPLLVDVGVSAVEFDAVYFFRVGNEGYIKRLQRIPTAAGLVLRAISENRQAYEPFDIVDGMDFQVLGRVLKVWRSQDF